MTIRNALIILAAALVLPACGKQPSTAPEQIADSPPPAASVPADQAETLRPPEKPDTAALARDGETIESASSASSPIATAVAANTPAPAAQAPLRWKEGQHYAALPLAQPTSIAPGQVEVVEIFWYGCGHCYSLEPRVEAWERNKPDYIKLVRLPVIWNEVTREDARLYYTIEGLGKVSTLNAEVFRELHVNRRPTTVIVNNQVDLAATEKGVRAFLGKHGVSAADFDRHYRSFSTENKLRQAENLTRRYLADHTPLIVVQGKYTTDVEMAGGPDQLFEVVNDLAARELAGR